MMHADYTRDEAGRSLSWGAVFAGVVTFIALLITLSMISSALGFGQFDPTQANPFEGMGVWQILWLIVEFILSFVGAGFVAGATARRAGYLHGFLTWATSVIAFVVLISWLTMSALSAATSAAGTVLNAGTNAIGSVAQSASDAVTNGIQAVSDNISGGQADIDALGQQVSEVLTATDIPELQPEYLTNQLDGATSDISNAAKDILVNPENSDQIVSDTQKKLSDRVNQITEAVDTDTVANAVAQNTSLTDEEAQQATENIVDGYQKAAEGLRNGIQTASQQLSQATTQLQGQINQLANNAKAGADEATDTISKGFIWVFVGLVIGAVLATIGGYFGVNFSVNMMNQKRNERHVETHVE